ncbi:MAG: transcriptional regulator [Clostridia bacterium]|nr:transcriptional regulator [Clostridia bacterium]
MKKIDLNESNLFSKNIIELKLIADRMAEGKGCENGILFTNMHQILFILNRKEIVTPKEIIAELNIAKSNLAILAKKMISDGLIESHKDNSNKREIFYNITELGKETLQKRLDAIDEYYNVESKTALNVLVRAVEEMKKVENKRHSRRRKTNTK